ncbi:hypothetical protein TWF102_006269 [Orbilia oligospora]|uniref:Uncharacterized protein n=1 Tax=Orbilia oligospora TaxID=2813651 RepID=A0A7C8J980_ORBOL|nr:hypothetical protein TWF102_006269 [Orbilia oligospora]KAF3112651.1 hypothetical protein TWF103_002886 [Orbilia oligospora]
MLPRQRSWRPCNPPNVQMDAQPFRVLSMRSFCITTTPCILTLHDLIIWEHHIESTYFLLEYQSCTVNGMSLRAAGRLDRARDIRWSRGIRSSFDLKLGGVKPMMSVPKSKESLCTGGGGMSFSSRLSTAGSLQYVNQIAGPYHLATNGLTDEGIESNHA